MTIDSPQLRVLLVDDDEDDYIIARDLLQEVRGQRYALDWVRSYDSALEAIGRRQHDVYLLDYRLGERTGLELLREAIANGCKAPLILLTGQSDHEVDLEAMKAGAMDFLVKGQIDAALMERSIRYAVERNRVDRQQEELIRKLEEALAEVKVLSGLLPICSSCKKIRDDDGYWNQLEAYITAHSRAVFSHGICPDCARALYPERLKKPSP